VEYAFSNILKTLTIVLCFIAGTSQAWSQEIPDYVQIVSLRDTNYASIDSLLRPIRRNSDELTKFIKACKKGVDYKEGIAYAYVQIGINARNISEYPQALEALSEALKNAKDCKNVDFEVIAMNMLGVVHRRKEEIREALEYHKKALELAESSGKRTLTGLRNVAVARNSIGNIYISLRQPELALPEFLASIAIEEETNNKLGLAINYQNIGSIYEERKDLQMALSNYRTSLHYNNQINSNLGRIICQNSIGQVYLKQKRFREARQMIEPTIEKAEFIGDHYYLAMAKLNYGWALSEEGDLEQSEKYILESLKTSQERKMEFFISEAYRLLADINEKKGNYKEALDFNKLYNENQAKYLNESNQQYMADLIVKYDSDTKKNKISILEKENEIANLRLADNRKAFWAGAIGVLFLSGLFYILYRQNILGKEKEYLALEQRMMRSQMNPHFIFNSLNSIKLYIINNEKDKAVYYLNKFSKLIRTILATSKEKDITLKEELDTMELYMNIENIRFSNKIRFSLEIEEDVPIKDIKLPSMILQPFIENAIWHGLSAKEGLKRIELKVSRIADNRIEISVEDNGIGRIMSKEIKDKKTLKNRSVGIDLTKQRLQNYFKGQDAEHVLEIVDLYKGDEPAGTKVVLKIPFNFTALA
jgi:tetratricopeptide (TPR) repeat protein